MKHTMVPTSRSFLLLLCVSALTLVGCQSTKPSYSFDETIDFATVKTYAWASDSIPPQVATVVDFAYVDPRIRGAVDEELSAKGLKQVDLSAADALLTYRLALTGDVSPKDLSGQMTRSPKGESSRFIWAWDEYDQVSQEFVKGVLQIGMVSRETEKLIWSGSISTPVDIYEDMQRERGILRKLIGKLMAPYPRLP